MNEDRDSKGREMMDFNPPAAVERSWVDSCARREGRARSPAAPGQIFF